MRVLVLGGGPSVSEALEIVPANWPQWVISANEHGFKQQKFSVDTIAYCDTFHSGEQRPMVKALKGYGVPLVCKRDWDHPNFGFDAGFTAIALAVRSRGNEVVVAGVDCTYSRTKSRYFWHEGEKQMFFHVGAKARAAKLAEYYASEKLYRMPSMAAWPSWPEFKP